MAFFKVDMHTHIVPSEWPDFHKKFGYGGWITLDHNGDNTARMVQDGKIFRNVDCNCWDASQRIKECNESGVSVQVLSTVPGMGFNYWAKAQDALEVAQFLNNHIAQVVSDDPKRFIGLGTVPMQCPLLAVQEAIRCKRDLNFAGLQIGTHVNDTPLDDEIFETFWKTCEDLDLAIFIHPWDMVKSKRMDKYWFPWLVGMCCETTLAICSLLFGGVLERHPKLKVCFAHGGGSFLATLGRIDHGFKARPDLCQTKTRQLPSSFLNRIYVDSIVHDKDTMEFLIKKLSVDNILLGTDYPFPLGEINPGELIESMKLSQDHEKDRIMKAKMLGENALHFLGCKKSSFE